MNPRKKRRKRNATVLTLTPAAAANPRRRRTKHAPRRHHRRHNALAPLRRNPIRRARRHNPSYRKHNPGPAQDLFRGILLGLGGKFAINFIAARANIGINAEGLAIRTAGTLLALFGLDRIMPGIGFPISIGMGIDTMEKGVYAYQSGMLTAARATTPAVAAFGRLPAQAALTAGHTAAVSAYGQLGAMMGSRR